MYKVNDVVIYGTSGVCKILDICQKSFAGTVSNYYILKPLLQNGTTVFIPTDNSRLTSKMHLTLTQDKFNCIFRSVCNKTPLRPESEQERQSKFAEILESGNREALMLMIYDLHNYQTEQRENGRRLHLADERLLNSAESLLFDEVAYVFNIDRSDAAEFVKKQFEDEKTVPVA